MPVNFLTCLSKLPTTLGLCLLGVVCAVTPGFAQQQTTLAANQKRLLKQAVHVSLLKTSLAAALKSLHQQYNLKFVVDGKPITQQQDIDVQGTLQEVLDSLTATFDYNWTLTSSGVILMNKRFHNQQEMPQIHLAEVKQSAQDMLNALQGFPSHDDPSNLGEMIFDVVRRLNADQLHALRSGKHIPVTELSADQYNRAQAAMYCACFARTYRTWEDLLTLFNALPGVSLEAVNYRDANQYTVFLTEGSRRFPYPFLLAPTKIIAPSYPEK